MPYLELHFLSEGCNSGGLSESRSSFGLSEGRDSGGLTNERESEWMVSLARTAYADFPGGKARESVRTNTSVPSAFTFQWTAGVKSLSLFFISALQHCGESWSFDGEAGSAAASLDYTISKEPSWLVEMFGSRPDGKSILNSLIRRVNPNRKRPGPVRIFLVQNLCIETAIHCTLDGKQVVGKTLQAMALSIEKQLRGEKARGRGGKVISRNGASDPRPPLPPLEIIRQASQYYPYLSHVFRERSALPDDSGFLFPRLQKLLSEWIQAEISVELGSSENFSTSMHTASLRKIAENARFRKLSGRGASSVANLRPLTELEMLGISKMERDEGANPLEVRLTSDSIGAIALFTYLSKVEGCSINLSYPLRSTHDLVDAMRDGDRERAGDICSLNLATAGLFLGRGRNKGRGRSEYLPMIFSPKGRLRSLVCQSRASQSPLIYASDLRDDSSIVGMYFENLPKESAERAISARATAASLAPPERDECVLSWYPYAQLLSELYGMNDLGGSSSSAHGAGAWAIDNIFFCHRSLAEQPKCFRDLLVKIRQAWIALRESERMRALVTALIVSDTEYMTLVRRRAGFHKLPEVALRTFV